MQEAMDALGEKFYHSDRSLFFQSEAPAQTGNLSIFKSFNFEELQLHIHSGEREEGLQIFREFFRQLNYTSSDLSLKKIAAAVFAAPAYVSSLFKKEMGLSVTEYITVCRMQRAAELLHSRPDSSLTAISEQVGYTDPYYFSRCFKRYYGVTPSKFLFSHAQQEPAGDERRERRDEGGTLQN